MFRLDAMALAFALVTACSGSEFTGASASKVGNKGSGSGSPSGSATASGTGSNTIAADPNKDAVEVGRTKNVATMLPGVKPTGCKVADPNIASCDPATGEVEGLAPGKTDVTVETASGPQVIHLDVVPTGALSGSTGGNTSGNTETGPGNPGTGDTTGGDPETIDVASDDVNAVIDVACEHPENGNNPDSQLGVSPKGAPLPPTVPAECHGGFEFNNLESAGFSIDATPAEGARAVQLEVDVATYTAGDRMSIRAVLADGKERLIFDTCRLRTWILPDPTGGKVRPPEVTIRDFRPRLPKGTKKLKFDFTGAKTPTYMHVRGLCDFNRTAAFYAGSPASKFGLRPVD